MILQEEEKDNGFDWFYIEVVQFKALDGFPPSNPIQIT